MVERVKELAKSEPSILEPLIDRQQNRWKMDALDQMIFHPGFSTAGQATEDAGRGVAQHVVSECDSLALAIQETGRTVVNIATTISAETEALAELLRKHGEAMGVRIEEFMTMSDRVRDKMREVHGDVAGVSGEQRSPASQHRNSEETEM